MPQDDPLYPPESAGEYLGDIPTSTLQWWRHKRRGPAYVKIGHRVFYRKSALDAFLDAGIVEPEAA